MVPEQKVSVNLQGMKETLAGFKASFQRRELWLIAGFLFLYNFSPGLSTPLYFTMTDHLQFSQGYIGILSSISAAGWVIAALLYRRLFHDLTLKKLLNLSIALGTLTTAAFVLLSNETSAAMIYFCVGLASMLAMVASLTLAADYCPPRAEGFAFAVLMSVSNLASSTRRQCRLVPLHPHIRPQCAAAGPDIGGGHGVCLRAGAAATLGRQAAG